MLWKHLSACEKLTLRRCRSTAEWNESIRRIDVDTLARNDLKYVLWDQPQLIRHAILFPLAPHATLDNVPGISTERLPHSAAQLHICASTNE